jgi:hypothetical protein
MAKKLDTKIFETKDLEAMILAFADCHCLSHDYASYGLCTRLDVTRVSCGRVWKIQGALRAGEANQGRACLLDQTAFSEPL